MRKMITILEPFGDINEYNALAMGFTPSVDVYEDNDNVIVEASLAGVSAEDVDISIDNDVLTIEGKVEKRSEVDEKNYYRKEVRTGSFHRSVGLPVSVRADKAEASFKDGVLKVTIPKSEDTKPRKIEIKTS